MGSWRVSADLLASSRFLLSPLSETVAALTVLGVPTGPWQRVFHSANRAAFDEMLAHHPVRRDLVDRSWRPRRGDRAGWMADFLGIAPPRSDMSFDDELATARRQLGRRPDPIRAARGPTRTSPGIAAAPWSGRRADRPAELGLDGHDRGRLATPGTDTAGRRGIAYDPAGNARLVRRRTNAGCEAEQWLGDGRLQINRYDLPERDLSAAQSLMFIPVHSTGSWVAWEEPTRYAIVYPVTGALAPTAAATADGLARLIGANRARLLAALDDPRSTTHLAALSGLPIGAVGNHLKVMLEAGLVLRRRAGREVLYWRTGARRLAHRDHRPAHELAGGTPGSECLPQRCGLKIVARGTGPGNDAVRA